MGWILLIIGGIVEGIGEQWLRVCVCSIHGVRHMRCNRISDSCNHRTGSTDWGSHRSRCLEVLKTVGRC